MAEIPNRLEKVLGYEPAQASQGGCQFPTFKYDPCGPWACGRSAPVQRGEWHFCERHAKEYDRENPQ